MTETRIRVKTTLGVTDHNLLDNRFEDNQHTINAISGLEEALESKQDVLTAGENIEISEEGVISATDTTYTAGENVQISEEGVISATDTTYTAGENVEISEEGVISATDTTYTAGTGIDITNGVISNTQTSAEWGNIEGNLNSQTDLKNALDAKANSADLAIVATSGSYTDLSDKPTIADGILTIQTNGTTVDTFTANSSANKTVNLIIPTTAADVSAMPDSVKYAASITVSIDSSNYQVTTTLKDQDGNTLGTAQMIDLPLESVVVSGSYDDTTKNVVLTLQNGSTITFSVADLVSGLQSEITAQNKLDADLVDDTTSVNKFVTTSDKTTWNGKQDAISDLDTIRAGANAGATAVQAGDLATVATTGNYADLSGKPTIPAAQIQSDWNQSDNTSLDYIKNKPIIPAAQIQSDWNQSDNSSLDYIKNKPTIPEEDNSTIVVNAQNKLAVDGITNKNTVSGAINPIKEWHGTQAQYNAGGSQTFYNWQGSDSPTIVNTDVPAVYTPTSQWQTVTYADKIKNVNGIYMAFTNSGYYSPENLIYSTNLATWQSVRANNQIDDIAYGNGVYVASGYSSVTTSTDLQTWTPVSSLTSSYYGVAYGNNKFVLWDRTAKNTVLSTDGLTWSASTGTFPQTWETTKIIFVNGYFIAYNGGGSGAYCYSTDGETWTNVTMPSSESFAGIAYDGTNYVLLGSYRRVFTGTDLENWTQITRLTGTGGMNVAYGNNRFVVALGNRAYQSTDHGATWTDFVDGTYPNSLESAKDMCFAGNKFAVLFGQAVFGATGESGSGSILNIYTNTDTPTTASTVYSAPDVSSVLTITAVGTGIIDVSDGNTYNYNSGGNETVTYTIGDLHPDYLCFINGVGVKVDNNVIANKQIQADYSQSDSSAVDYIKNKPVLAAVATSGVYSDLSNKPTIPTVNNSQITITQGGVTKGSFTLNQASGDTIALDAGSSSDNSTISLNASDQLQALGVKEARTDTPIRFWHGTQAQYNNGGTVKDTYYDWETFPHNTSTLTADQRWISVAFGDNKFVTASNTDKANYSSDGQTWTASTLPASNTWSVGYGNGRFVALSGYITAYSDDGGETWTQGPNLPQDAWVAGWYIIYADNKFVAVTGNDANVSVYSTDGINWYSSTFTNQAQRYSIAYGNGKFITICNGTNILNVSTDGQTWNTVTLPKSKQWRGIAYGNNTFVILADSDSTTYYSTDGVNWVEGDQGNNVVTQVTFANNKFVALSNYGSYIKYSKDGITWSNAVNILNTGYHSIPAYNNGLFVTVNEYSNVSESFSIDSVYTLDENPTTASAVYSAPEVASALTITAVGTGTITLSDTNTYTYNADGNAYSYYSVGESYPNYVCNIDGVGLKIGTTFIADYSAPAIGDIDTALTAIIAQGS